MVMWAAAKGGKWGEWEDLITEADDYE